MKRLKKLSYLLGILMVTTFLITSCNKDDDPKPQTVTIINKTGSITLKSFRVVFINGKGETLTDRDYGTFNPDDEVTAEIPTGAEEYYMATKQNNSWFFSPDYAISITTNKLTTDGVGEWTSR